MVLVVFDCNFFFTHLYAFLLYASDSKGQSAVQTMMWAECFR